MNNFHDILLPDFISIHLKGGPVFATNIAASISGREIRITEREYSMQKYIISGCKLSENQFQDFNCFFRSRKGCSHAFRMRDYADYKIENQVVEPRSD